MRSDFSLIKHIMAINVSVQHNGEFLSGIRAIFLTQCYYRIILSGTRLNAMKRFCICSLL